jgi:REP element-mobilizing transposase RayT
MSPTKRPDESSDCDATFPLQSGFHSRGYLPHLEREGATYFVTFRLVGTLPKSVLEAYRLERDAVLQRAETLNRPLSGVERNRLDELFSKRIDAYLDAGHGECWLARKKIAELVVGALEHFDGVRYTLYESVVMPNHVHVVVAPTGRNDLSDILHSWKSYTANEANKILQRRGDEFWQRESYDHLVRDEKDFQRVCNYTVNNPVKAGLCKEPQDWKYGSAAKRSE